MENNQPQQTDVFNNIKDPFSKVAEVSTIIAGKEEENKIIEPEINLNPFEGNTNLVSQVQSEENQNNTEPKNNNANISPLVSNNPLYIEAHSQNQNLFSNIKTDSNISSENNNNDTNLNNLEKKLQNMNMEDNKKIFGETTESIINNSQNKNETNNKINNQSNNNMVDDEEEEKINFASKIEGFNTNQNQQHISVPSLTGILAQENMNNNNNNINNQNI